jgi:glycosyltransferase involved in cell wall biosynthesis
VNIAFLNPGGALGGAETALLDLVAVLRDVRPGWMLGLIASSEGPLVERAGRLGVSCEVLPFPASLARLGEWGKRGSVRSRLGLGFSAARVVLPTLGYEARLRQKLKSLGPDIVHTNGFKMHVLGARCTPAAAQLVWHLHDYAGSRPLTAALMRMFSRRSAAILANSESVARHTAALLGTSPPIHCVYNSVDLETFHPEGNSLDLDRLSNLPPSTDVVRVGLIGTFARWKGHEVFLDALSRLTAPRAVRAYIIGGPIYQTDGSQHSIAELRGIASRFRLNGTVGFTGRLDDVPAALRALDIVVHASTEPEPFGLVIAEAMACGRPIVVSGAGGAREIAEGCALFHRPGDAGDLADCLKRLIEDPALRSAQARAGRLAAERLFSRRHLAETVVPIYESVGLRH